MQHLVILSSDNKLEMIKVNIDNKESILKKLMRQEKRKALKRKREEDGEDNQDVVPNIKIDKDALTQNIQSG
jgi:hypothetical protein